MISEWIVKTPGTRTNRKELFDLYKRRSSDSCSPNCFYTQLRRYGFKETKGITRDFLDVSIREIPVLNLKIITDKKGYVYFVTDGRFVKIGSTTNIDERLKNLQVANSEPLVLLKTLYFDDRFQAERNFHSLFKNHKVVGEWFDILDRLIF